MGSKRVVLVCFPGVEILDLAGPASVFSAATQLLRGRPGYRVELAAQRRGACATAAGVKLVASRKVSDLRGPIDTLLVGGGLPRALEAARSLVPALERLSRRSRRTASVCTGAFLLAEAGLLRGRRAATHWAACAELRRLHPDVKVEGDPIFVRDRRVWTSAGVTAGLDLALAMVEEDHGPKLALEVARWLVMYLRRPGGQSQFSAPLQAQRAERDGVAGALTWARDNLRGDLSVDSLAARAGMSVRNFSRVVRRQTGATPSALVERLRLESARRALELTRRSVKQIAHASGFGTTMSMHRAFRRALDSTPLQYRERFASS